MVHSVIKAMPIQFINDKCHINGKAAKLPYPVIMGAFHVTCYYFPLGRTHTHTLTLEDETISRNQVRGSRRPMLTWFKKGNRDVKLTRYVRMHQ